MQCSEECFYCVSNTVVFVYFLCMYCSDLKVLGKGDLRVMLRWLKKLREYKKELEAVDMEDVSATKQPFHTTVNYLRLCLLDKYSARIHKM